MNQVIQLHGTEKRLYSLIGPLVMNPEILKQNYNYPFKTTENYEWLVALDPKEKVTGFFPVEKRATSFVINNYYVSRENEDLLEVFLKEAINLFFSSVPFVAVVFTEHEGLFKKYGFIVEKKWKLYVKMRKIQ